MKAIAPQENCMKKTLGLSIALLMCATGATGCGPSHEGAEGLLEVNRPTTVPDEEQQDKEEGFVRQQRYMPTTDPNLDPNWDWTVSGAGHTVYYTDLNGVIRSKVVQVPFYTSGHPLNTLEKDMYKEDGWVLAFRDFGTPSAAPNVPMFALYNKYRGILRIMFYNSRELTYYKFSLELVFKSPSATGALFTYAAPTRAFLNDYDPTKLEVFMVEANAIDGWIYGDFMLAGYDPNLNPSTQLRLQVRGLDMTSVTLESTEFTLSEVLSDANPSSQLGSPGGALIPAINQGYKFYKTAEKVSKALREKAGSGSGWWKNIVQSLVGTKSTPSTLSKVAPIVGGLVGFITSFIGGVDDPAPREPLNFEGSLKMSGTAIQSEPLFAMDFGLQYATGINPPDYYRVLNPITWGLFNLNTKPQMTSAGRMVCPTFEFTDCYEETSVYPLTSIAFSFNPAAGMQLVSVNYAFTFSDRHPTSFMPDPFYVAYAYYDGRPWDPLPTGIAVEVRMRASSPTRYFDDDIVYYKVYPL
jgi:hypothetical protein